MSSLLRKATFVYSEEVPSQWEQLLRDIASVGVTVVSVPVYWGAHERLRGTRDFTSPRLKIERLISLIAASGLTAELRVGFPANEKSWPEWTKDTYLSKTWVPSVLWGDSGGDFQLRDVPSAGEPPLLEEFRSFLGELLSIVSLYMSPEGPIDRIVFDPGVYSCDLGLVETSVFHQYLKDRYKTPAVLNQHYGTFFSEFEAAAGKNGFRVLSDKRPWLFGNDYKTCRNRFWDSWVESFRSLPGGRVLVRDNQASDLEVAGSQRVWLDATLLELNQGEPCFPFSPGRYCNSAAALSYRLAHAVYSRGIVDGFSLEFLSELSSEGSHKNPTVFSGKFLSSSAYVPLEAELEKGGVIFFPLEIPQYNENLDPFPWTVPKERFETVLGETKLVGYPWKNGKVLGYREQPALGPQFIKNALALGANLKEAPSV